MDIPTPVASLGKGVGTLVFLEMPKGSPEQGDTVNLEAPSALRAAPAEALNEWRQCYLSKTGVLNLGKV